MLVIHSDTTVCIWEQAGPAMDSLPWSDQHDFKKITLSPPHHNGHFYFAYSFNKADWFIFMNVCPKMPFVICWVD